MILGGTISEKVYRDDVAKNFTWRSEQLCSVNFNPLSANFTKMVKHTQTIRRQIADELFECVWLFCGIGS